MAEVVLRDVRKFFNDSEIIRGVDLNIGAGEFTVFVGPSGCGKSTLLRMIAGLEDISAGELHIGGSRADTLPPARRGVAMVFQSYALYPHMSVYDNMAFGLKLAKEDGNEVRARVTRAAEVLQLGHLLQRKPRELSGGQRQRVAIGRAIVRKPRVFLFDEPLSNLDAALRVQMRIELANLHKQLGTTMIYVTHDQVEAMTLADKIVVLNRGQVEQVGAPLELYNRPRNLFVAGFLGSPKMNFIDGRLDRIEAGLAVVDLPGGATLRLAVDAAGATPGDAVTVGVRPEHFEPATSGASLVGTVKVIEHLGDQVYAYVDVPGTRDGLLVVRLEPETAVRAGDVLALAIPAAQCHLFDAGGTAFARRAALNS
ncbi:ABC transporter ATP-binding protein [Chitinimonas koreensis]|uniref:ABC transporter ATP-binding protein n=1 Tax=Chitinimonas koreensis TaxID=356302 RepID=UPI000418758C|nr:sn-glycerol-3-phosphate ABC transporter ATP-binding protein UgpC [Chitinimonas koreensis]QNM98519.1 sn-glycerol-3-phosphate ABC transporter ATP-binding protein UgpC [Chitinimonas koreensis]